MSFSIRLCLNLDWAFSGICGVVPATNYALGRGDRATVSENLFVPLLGGRWRRAFVRLESVFTGTDTTGMF